MDAAHWHLILTHFPIVGTIIGSGMMAFSYLIKSKELKKVALVTFVLMAIFTIPVYYTGEEAEAIVEHIAGVSEQQIEIHEKLAEMAVWLMGFLGLLSLINYFVLIKRTSFAKTLSLITLIVSLGTSIFLAKLGNTGGEIRHSEIRKNNENNNRYENHEHYYDD